MGCRSYPVVRANILVVVVKKRKKIRGHRLGLGPGICTLGGHTSRVSPILFPLWLGNDLMNVSHKLSQQ